MSSSGQNSTAASTQSTRQKSDPAWNYVREGRHPGDGKRTFSCLLCGKTLKGGGINRMKQHLAGRKGEVGPCPKATHDIKFQMEESLKSIVEKKQEAQERFEINNPYGSSHSQFEGDGDDDDDDVQEIPVPKRRGISINEGGGSGNRSGAKVTPSGKGKARGGIANYFAPRTTPGSQPSIKSALANKEAVRRADMAIAMFWYDACIPFNALNSLYYQPMLDAVAAIGPGYKGPTYHAVRIPLLRDAKREVQLFIDSYKNSWGDSGCTIMADGWTDGRQRTLINFLVYCPRGMTFVKSVDASDIVKDANNLFNLFQEVVEWVGPSNIVHMVTDISTMECIGHGWESRNYF